MTPDPPFFLLLPPKALILGSVDSFPGTAGLSKEGEGWAIEKQLGRGIPKWGGTFPSWPSHLEPLGGWCEEAILGWGESAGGMDHPRSLPTCPEALREKLCVITIGSLTTF